MTSLSGLKGICRSVPTSSSHEGSGVKECRSREGPITGQPRLSQLPENLLIMDTERKWHHPTPHLSGLLFLSLSLPFCRLRHVKHIPSICTDLTALIGGNHVGRMVEDKLLFVLWTWGVNRTDLCSVFQQKCHRLIGSNFLNSCSSMIKYFWVLDKKKTLHLLILFWPLVIFYSLGFYWPYKQDETTYILHNCTCFLC